MAHTHDRLCYTVESFIVHDARVLLRKHDKYNIWLSIGGHIESGEDPAEAAIREAKEEVGLDIAIVDNRRISTITDHDGWHELPTPHFAGRHPASPELDHFCLGFVATATTDQVVTEIPNETWRWFTADELNTEAETLGIKTSIKLYALHALKTVAELNKQPA